MLIPLGYLTVIARPPAIDDALVAILRVELAF